MSHTRRLSQSVNGSGGGWSASPAVIQVGASESGAPEWTGAWASVYARDLIDGEVVVIGANTSVEDACDRLSSEDLGCLVVANDEATGGEKGYLGLFDYSDVNAFLTLAATRHTFSLNGTDGNDRRDKIIEAAMAGSVPVHLVSNLSDKNPLVTLPHDATIISLLEIFSRGTHRVLIQAADDSAKFSGIVSDRALLSWFASYAKSTPSFRDYLSNALQTLPLPSFNATTSVVAALASATILDAMRLMSEDGVSSIAVLEDESGVLLSAVSVTDIGKIVIPSQSNQFLITPLHQFISLIKHPDGSTDGVDKYPVYSVLPSSPLLYTIEKILATNAHRVFVARESTLSSPILGPSAMGNLCGIVSIVDILALFAKLAGIRNVDPTEMQRHRRQSSSSSHSSGSRGSVARSRSNSVNIRRSPSVIALSPSMSSPMDSPVPLDSLHIPTVVPERRRSIRMSKPTIVVVSPGPVFAESPVVSPTN
ncbi:hypothetical protein BKA70DRAFT_1415845 [Coprinopsis sp. MPI-PUGE-AT-0042]|nr:hypothetical protein BKA70DRAFT_1415845 [Coprinopsis sp. MPI-PUGE-AT-0042]